MMEAPMAFLIVVYLTITLLVWALVYGTTSSVEWYYNRQVEKEAAEMVKEYARKLREKE